MFKTNKVQEDILNNLKLYTETVYDLLDHLQNTDEFKTNIEPEIQQHFYHSYTKCKRNFKAINVLINSKDIENGYVESAALLRIMVEGYFHLCYITDPKQRKESLKAYEKLKKYEIKLMLNDDSGYKVVTKGYTDAKYLEAVKKDVNKIKRSQLQPFNNIYEFAKKTGNEIIYNHIYTKFNSYVHFNPTTYMSYGTENKEGIFNFDSYEPSPLQEAEILYYSIDVMMRLYATVLKYLRIEKVDINIFEKTELWLTLKEEYKRIRE